MTDSRGNKLGSQIRRRRRCLSCDKKFTTYETTRDPLELKKSLDKAIRVATVLRAVCERLDLAIEHG